MIIDIIDGLMNILLIDIINSLINILMLHNGDNVLVHVLNDYLYVGACVTKYVLSCYVIIYVMLSILGQCYKLSFVYLESTHSIPAEHLPFMSKAYWCNIYDRFS